MDTYTQMAGVGLDAGSSGGSMLGVWNGRANSPQAKNATDATKVLRDLLREQAADERIHNYTAEGRAEVRQRRARPALRSLGDILDKVSGTQREELARAANESDAEIKKVAPPYTTNSSLVHIDLECARILREQGVLRHSIVSYCEGGDLPAQYLPFACAIVRLPAALCSISGEQQGVVFSYLAGGNRYHEVLVEAGDVRAIINNATRRVCIECGLGLPALAAISQSLADLLAGGAHEPRVRPLTGNEAGPVYTAASADNAPPVEAVQ